MSLLRAILGTLSIGGAAVGFGRAFARKQIDRSVTKTIDAASAIARERVRTGASQYLKEAWRDFLAQTLIKLVVLAGLAALSYWNIIPPTLIVVLASLFLVINLGFDIFRRRDLITHGFSLVRAHGVRPREIIRFLVAERVFDEVLAESQSQDASLVRAVLLRLGGRSQSDLERYIAETVSQTAADTAWADLAPFVRTAALRLVILMAVYSAFATLILRDLTLMAG